VARPRFFAPGLALGAALAFLPLSSAKALGPAESIRPDLGVIIQLNLDPSSETTHLITNILGAAVVLPFSSGSAWAFEPSADLYWTYYELFNGRAMSTEIADREAFVIGLLLNAPVVYSLPLGGNWSCGFGAGLGLNLRGGFQASSDVPTSDVAAINTYFWSKARFIMPSTLARVEYKLTQRIDFGFSALAYWPIFNLWSGEGLSFLDQAIFGGALLVRYHF